MQKKYSILCALGIVVASLSSCSRANYSFNNSAPAYIASEQVHPATETAPASANEATVATAAIEATPQTQVTAAHEAAAALAHRQAPTSKPLASTTNSAETVAAPTKLDHATRKALRQELKRQLSKAPAGTTAGGKSQLVALLLLIFLGGLGIHRFYLGYTGMGILYIALLLTSFLIVPAIALFVLLIIDLIRIITGSLKPKNGEYGKTL